MEMKWTPEQQKVIETRNANVLVSAAAGSGKTAVLVARILSMITDLEHPVSIDELLIVTFTRAAAGEMRERIRLAIEARIEEEEKQEDSPKKDQMLEHLRKQNTLLHHALITTIDSFCAYIVRNYFHLIDLDPSFRVGEEGELRMLQGDVAERILSEAYEEGSEEFHEFVEAFSTGRSDDGLVELIRKLYTFSTSYPYPKEWLVSCKDAYQISSVKEVEQAPWMQLLKSDIEKNLEEIRMLAEAGIALCRQEDGPYLYEEALSQDLKTVELLLKTDSFEAQQEIFSHLSYARLSGKKMPEASENKKELVKNYLYLIHKVNGLEPVSLLPEDMTVQDQEVDSFLKYYSKDQKRPKKRKLHAFQIRRKKKDGNHLHVHESVVSVQAVLKRSRELGVSMTVFLTALFMMAINEEMSKMQKKKPVVLMVPVNLRKFFPSLSMLNFFNWIEPGYNFTTQDQSFEAILKYTKEFFETELTKEKMSAHISELLALELHPILRLAPLELKNLCIQAGAKYSEKNTTAIFSNMSAVKMPKSYVPYIERFGVYTNTPKMELCLCSFQDKLSFAFTSRYDTENIERNFYRLLKEQGISDQKVEPEFPKTDEPSEQEMKVYKIYSFLCIAIVAAMLVTECNFHPRIRWTLFTAGGVVTMWIASSIGFFKRYNLLKNAMWQLFIGTIICFIWDALTGWHSWSVDLVLPIMSVSTLTAMFVIAKVRKCPVREYLIYEIMAAGYGLILPGILLLCKVVKNPTVSMFGALICFLFLVAVILFKGREFKEEMQKNLHV